MKKIILSVAWVFMSMVALAEPAAQEPAAAVSSFANSDNVFMGIAIILVAAFVMIPVYSMSIAVKVLARKVVEK